MDDTKHERGIVTGKAPGVVVGKDELSDAESPFHISCASVDMPDTVYKALLEARVSEASVALNFLMDGDGSA